MSKVYASPVPSRRSVPVPYTASPFKLLWNDIILCLCVLWAVPGIFLPLTPWRSRELDEFFPSYPNLFAIAVHGVLLVVQSLFVLSLPLCVVFMVPLLWSIVYFGSFILVNYWICRITLNGPSRIRLHQSNVNQRECMQHQHEDWMFINGIAVGNHWLQSNLNQLAYTFGRKVTGVCNPTYGIIFDIIACLIQRCFNYATRDIRTGYALVKNSLLDPKYKKIVLILHSQGGIEGAMIIDWLLAELPQDALLKLEVYTFGSAANHFNNPNRSVRQLLEEMSPHDFAVTYHGPSSRCIPYIEHYTNSEDFVSLWGVLNFAHVPHRYMGALFIRSGSGHLLNQHYLDTMFTLGPDHRVLEHNQFMDAPLCYDRSVATDDNRRAGEDLDMNFFYTIDDPVEAAEGGYGMRVKDQSRLWKFRNGGTPEDWHQKTA